MVKDSLGLLEVAGLLGLSPHQMQWLKLQNVMAHRNRKGERTWLDDRKGCW